MLQTPAPLLVGREPQLLAGRDFLDRVAAGGGGTLLVRGDAGTGKTRLVRELVDEARRREMTVLGGGCVAIGGEPMRHAALIELLRGSDANGAGGAAGLSTEEMLERLLGLLDAVDVPPSLLLVVEDVHWADRSTCEILTVLSRQVAGRPLGLVMTSRDDELGPDHDVRRFLTELVRSAIVREVRVGPLSAAESAHFIETLLGPIDASTLGAIFRRSGGNPLIIEELCAGGVEGATRALDGPLREIMLTRFWRLSPPARDVVRAVAVAGAPVEQVQLPAVVGCDDATCGAALREAIDLHVLTLLGNAIGFRHVLMAEAVYGDLLPGERVHLHRRWAHALTETGRRDAPLLAHHWFEAGDHERAFGESLTAAGDATSMFAFDAAHRHYQRALKLWDRVDNPTAAAGATRIDLCLRSAETANWAGEAARAVEAIDVGLASLEPAPDLTLESVLLERRGWYLLRQGDAGAARAAYDRALAVLPTNAATATRARVLAGSVRAYERGHEFERAVQLAREAVALTLDADAAAEIGPAHYMLGRMLLTVGDIDAAVDALQRSARAAEDALNPVLLAIALLEWSDALARRQQVADVIPAALGAAERLRARGYRDHALLAAATAASMYYRLGRAHDGRALAASILGDANTPVTQAAGHLLVGVFDAEFESLAMAREHLEAARLLAAPLLEGRVAAALAMSRTEIALAEGNLDGATSALEEGLPKVAHTGDDEALAHLCLLGLRVEAQREASALGRSSERARRRRDERVAHYEERIDAVLAGQPPGAWRPDLVAISRARDAERTRLDGPSDPDAWEVAADAWDDVQWPRWAVYAEMRRAEAVAAMGTPSSERVEAFERARARATAIDSPFVLAEVGRLAARAGAAPTGGTAGAAASSAGPPGGLELTRREREVLDLVAEGATNRQIASRLFISEKTASVHVSRILTKLGATNRQEAAAIARRAALRSRGRGA